MPDFALEDSALTEIGPDALIAGVDEVGRGPWAGPVVAAAVILKREYVPDGLDDSKALGKARREALFEAIQEHAIIGYGSASVEEIDDINILQASLLAMTRAVEALGVAPHIAPDRRQPRAKAHLPGPAHRQRRLPEPFHRRRLDNRQGHPRPADGRTWRASIRPMDGSETQDMVRGSIRKR